MDNPSFAELKEKFSKMNVLPYPKPRASTIDNDSSSDPPALEKPKNEISNQSPDNARSKLSVPTATSSRTSNETALPHVSKLPPIRQHGGSSLPLKKGPIPLPRPVTQQVNVKASSEVSSITRDPSLPRTAPSPVNTVSASNPPPVVHLTTSDSEENTYIEISNEISGPSFSSDTSEMASSYENPERPCLSLPVPAFGSQRKNSYSESLSVSLDAMLPLKCMFFEFETTINEYQRRDPRTIIFPKIKATMPKMTSDEINTLQRYSNT